MSLRSMTGPLWPLVRPAFPDEGRYIVQRPVLNALARHHPLTGRVLNAGCGEGLYCGFLESFAGVTAIDNVDIAPADDFLDRHRDPRHRIRQGSLTALPFGDEAFDAVLCTEVIEHVQDDGAAARELARVLKPGGTLIASVPQLPAPADPNHAREGYSASGFRELLEQAGFDVQAHRSCCHGLLRAVMHYWRHPWFAFGRAKTPYVPNAMMQLLARADRVLPIGRPWDLAVRAVRRP